MNDELRSDTVRRSTKSKLPVVGEIDHPAIWWPLWSGLALLAIALIVEYGVQLAGGEIVKSAPVDPQVSVARGVVSLIFRWESVVLILKELGFAFIIGWIVSYFIEAAAKREQNDSFKHQMEEIGKQAFRGVFGLKHQDRYVRSVIEKCLEAKLVREGYSIAYTLDPFTAPEARKYGFESGRFVKVMAEIRYRARNVGTERDKFKTTYGIPVRSGKLQALSQLKSLKVGQMSYSPDQIRRAIVNDPGDNESHPDEANYLIEFELEPDESVEISFEAQLVKEMSDSETFGFGLPTMDAKLALTVNLPNMVLGAAPRIIGKLDTERAPDDGRKGEWKIDHPILPYNSVILWWRTKADDGSAEEAAEQLPPLETPTTGGEGKPRKAAARRAKAAVNG